MDCAGSSTTVSIFVSVLFKREGTRRIYDVCDIDVSDKTQNGTTAFVESENRRIQLLSCEGKFREKIEIFCEPSSVAFTNPVTCLH